MECRNESKTDVGRLLGGIRNELQLGELCSGILKYSVVSHYIKYKLWGCTV